MAKIHQVGLLILSLVSDHVHTFQESGLIPNIGTHSASHHCWVRHPRIELDA